MNSRMKMIYWKSEQFWLGKLLEHPEIMTQGENLEELEENYKRCVLIDGHGRRAGKYEIKIAIGRERSLSDGWSRLV